MALSIPRRPPSPPRQTRWPGPELREPRRPGLTRAGRRLFSNGLCRHFRARDRSHPFHSIVFFPVPEPLHSLTPSVLRFPRVEGGVLTRVVRRGRRRGLASAFQIRTGSVLGELRLVHRSAPFVRDRRSRQDSSLMGRRFETSQAGPRPGAYGCGPNSRRSEGHCEEKTERDGERRYGLLQDDSEDATFAFDT